MNLDNLILPTPRNPQAEALCEALPRLGGLIRNANKQQLMSALVTEANTLPAATDIMSVMVCAKNICMLGLLPGGVLGHVFLVTYPFRKGPNAGKTICQVIPGYRGYIELAYRSRYMSVIHPPMIVLRDESFETWSDEKGNHFLHRPDIDFPAATRDNVRGAYVSWQTQSGGHAFVYVSRSQLDEVDTQRQVWRTNYPAMVRKTAIRRAAPVWQQTEQLALAVQLDDEQEMGVMQTAPQRIGEAVVEPDVVANTLVNLKHRLTRSIGCTSDEERDAVVSWALAEDTRYGDIVANEEKMVNVMARIEQYTTEGGQWKDILAEAMSARRIAVLRPID